MMNLENVIKLKSIISMTSTTSGSTQVRGGDSGTGPTVGSLGGGVVSNSPQGTLTIEGGNLVGRFDQVVRAVSFDLWFTVIWEKVPEDEVAYSSMRISAIRDALRLKGFEVDLSKIAEVYRRMGSSRAILSSREIASLVLASLGIERTDELVREVASAYEYSTQSFRPRENPEVFEVLPTLKKMGFKIAIVSNTSFSSSGVRALLKNLGIDSFVDVIISSSDIGALKPQRRIFDELVNTLGVEAHEIVHVGDSCLEDVLGALSRGLKAVYYTGLLKLRNAEVDSLCLAIAPSIENLGELPKLLTNKQLLIRKGL